MRTIHAAIIWAVLLVSVTSTYADGGLLHYWVRQPGYEIAVFTLPTPITVGPLDISVMILETSSGNPVIGATINLELASSSQPNRTIRQSATKEVATNKLFYAASVDLPSAGLWTVDMNIAASMGAAHARFNFSAGDAPPPSTLGWVWHAWPVLVVVLYTIHQWLVTRKSNGRPTG